MPARPNILFIISDQMVAALTGAYGHPVVQTPHLSRLSASTQPTPPSRSARPAAPA